MARTVTDNIEKLRPYQGGKPVEELFREQGISDAVKLASNENPLGPSPRAVEAARATIGGVSRYPDGAAFRLQAAIAAHHGVSVGEVLHGNGSSEIIELMIRTFTTHEHHVIFGQPAFSMYRIAVMAHGPEFTVVPTRDFVHDLRAMAAAVRPNTRVILLDNPNNPTGTYVGREDVEWFLREVPPEVLVVLDEAYLEYATAVDYPNGLELRHLRERLVVTRTFSKVYGLAGLRVGYGVGPREVIDYANRLRPPFNVSTPAQEAAIAALEDDDHLERSVELNTTERTKLSEALTELGVDVTPSQANFILADFHEPAPALYERLLTKGVIVRPIPGLDNHLRITIGTDSQNERFLRAYREVKG